MGARKSANDIFGQGNYVYRHSASHAWPHQYMHVVHKRQKRLQASIAWIAKASNDAEAQREEGFVMGNFKIITRRDRILGVADLYCDLCQPPVDAVIVHTNDYEYDANITICLNCAKM